MNNKTAACIGAAAFITGVIIMVAVPRGVRNNNPLNIRKSSNKWEGKSVISLDPSFETFTNPTFGFRAGMKLLNTYYHRHGLKTVEGIIGRFAPPVENNTGAYVNAVSKALNVSPNEVIDLNRDAPALLQAIAHHENGGHYYNINMIKAGVSLA
jgi:hypothetical protein